MRILHTITTLDVGGAEMHLLAQVRGQVRRGHCVRVGYLKGAGSLRGDFLDAGAEQVQALGTSPATVARLWPQLRWAEIVHSHLLKADLLTALLACVAGRRRGLIASKHNDEAVLRRPWVGRVHGAIGRLPRRTIVLSDHVGRFIESEGRVPRSRQTRIYYGLDPAPFEAARAGVSGDSALRSSLGFAREDVVFTCVARFAAQKAHDVLLRGFALALERRVASDPPLRLLLVGDDPFGDGRERAQALAKSLELGSAVHFTGVRRDVPDLLAHSDVFVMTSLWEGLGLVFLEAMATRLPVLATHVSAVPEVVVDSQTGLLVPPSDPGAVAEAMLALARDPRTRRRMGEAGRARVLERFDLDRMVDETLAVYSAALSPDGGVKAPRAAGR